MVIIDIIIICIGIIISIIMDNVKRIILTNLTLEELLLISF